MFDRALSADEIGKLAGPQRQSTAKKDTPAVVAKKDLPSGTAKKDQPPAVTKKEQPPAVTKKDQPSVVKSFDTANGPNLNAKHQYTPGLDNTMLLLQGDLLIRLGADGVTEMETWQLGAKYSHIAERRNYFVALSEAQSVVVLNKTTMKPIRERKFQYMELTDLALHPKLPVTYIAVCFDIEAPRYRVILFDENTGDAREPKGSFGTWVRVHPAGTFLITGHKDIYERGKRFFINPGNRLHAMPDWGNIDLLISYALDSKGQPSLMDLKSKSGWKIRYGSSACTMSISPLTASTSSWIARRTACARSAKRRSS